METPDFSTVPFQKSHPVTPITICISKFMETKGVGICRIFCIELSGQAQMDTICLFLQDEMMIFSIIGKWLQVNMLLVKETRLWPTL